MSARTAQSDDYKKGYAAGYAAGRRHVENRHTLKRWYWACGTCDAVGMILTSSDDSHDKRHWRMLQSHSVKARYRKCRQPRVRSLMITEAARLGLIPERHAEPHP